MKSLVFILSTIPSSVSGWSLFGGRRKTCQRMEETVRRYFAGVNAKDPVMIRSCFGDTAIIRDVCGINDSQCTAKAQALVDRCMEFLAAHPDTSVAFHYVSDRARNGDKPGKLVSRHKLVQGPECGRASDWVVAHWYETGTWSGTSCGIPPAFQPMSVEGQTRFLVNRNDWTIQEFVVTRTFTEWEKQVVAQQQEQKKGS